MPITYASTAKNNIGHYRKADIKNKLGGFKAELLFAPAPTFGVIALPIPYTGGTQPQPGERYIITTDDTFTYPAVDGWISMKCKVDTTTAKAKTDADGVVEWSIEAEVDRKSVV